MQRKYLSNTNLLDGNFTDKDGASLVEVQNLACVRTSNKPPNVVPTDFMRSSRRRTRNTLAESSEKLDLMNILNCFARADCSNSLTSCSPTDRQQWHRDNNTSDVCSFDNSEGPLYNVLLDRFGERKYSTSHPVKTEAWPNKVDKRPKRRTVEQTIDTESADTPGELDLDAQLNAWSAPSNMDKHGLSGDQTVQLLSNEVRHSVVCVEGNQLVWRENNYIIPALNLSEPFRNPPTVLKELVRERLFLLDDHSIAVKVRRNGTQEGTNTNNGTGSANGAPRKSAFVNSKEYLLNKAVQKVDVSDVMSKVPEELQSAELKDSIKYQALEGALARHIEALADAALELVFQRLAPPLAVNPIAGANSSNINNNINISNNSNIHGNDRDKSKDTDNAGNNQAKRRHSVTSDIESEGSPIKKRKSRDTRATTSAAATVPAGAIRTLEAPVLFSWEDVLNCVKRPLTLSPRPTPTATATSAHATPQLASATGSAASASASSAAPTSAVAPTETAAQDGEEKTDEPKRRPANIVVHQSLPALHLTRSVVERTERRLRALYRGEAALETVRTVPSVFNYAPAGTYTTFTTTSAFTAASGSSSSRNKGGGKSTAVGGTNPSTAAARVAADTDTSRQSSASPTSAADTKGMRKVRIISGNRSSSSTSDGIDRIDEEGDASGGEDEGAAATTGDGGKGGKERKENMKRTEKNTKKGSGKRGGVQQADLLVAPRQPKVVWEPHK